MNQSTILKSLDPMRIRFVAAAPEHAEAFVNLQRTLASETRFLMLEPDEINSVERQKQVLSDFASPNSPAKVLFAFYDEEMIGYLGYRSVPLKKIRHTVRDIAVGILQQYQRLGAARALFAQAEKDWITAGKKVVRLSVMEANHRALALYEKLGFEIEGVENHSICLDNEWIAQKLLWKKLQ